MRVLLMVVSSVIIEDEDEYDDKDDRDGDAGDD